MDHPLELSDDLVRDAELAAIVSECSVGEQIEFWAHLGRAIEPFFEDSRAVDLIQRVAN
jgi:ParD-like antitoxin of type II bacterial toxin-antitoxin system